MSNEHMLYRTLTTLTALAERHDGGTEQEQQIANILSALVYAMQTGRLTHMEANVRVTVDAWMVQEARKQPAQSEQA